MDHEKGPDGHLYTGEEYGILLVQACSHLAMEPRIRKLSKENAG